MWLSLLTVPTGGAGEIIPDVRFNCLLYSVVYLVTPDLVDQVDLRNYKSGIFYAPAALDMLTVYASGPTSSDSLLQVLLKC